MLLDMRVHFCMHLNAYRFTEPKTAPKISLPSKIPDTPIWTISIPFWSIQPSEDIAHLATLTAR